MDKLLAIILLALSTGIDNFAVSAAIGLNGVKSSNRIRLALTIGIFETGMTILGIFIGSKSASLFGSYTNWLGGGLLIATAIYIIYKAIKNKGVDKPESKDKVTQQIITAASLSIDNLIVGFSLGSQNIPINEAIIIIAVISISLALLGMELGSRLSTKVEEYSEIISGLIIGIVGILICTKIL